MNSDEDDIYPSNEHGHNEVKMADFDDGEEEGEEVEEDDDSDDEVNFITDAKEEPKQDPASQTKRQSSVVQAVTEIRKASSTPTPVVRGGSALDNKAVSETPNDRPGTDYPARHTSKLDPNGNPVLPATGKPVLSTDFDTDFASDSSKPWRRPGSDITDYFNYGFDEFTWASYCLKQEQMPKEIKEINQVAEQMKAFVEGIPGGTMPGMPGVPSGPSTGNGAMPQLPGMPSEAEMQQMFQSMMSQGIDPTSMDSNQFMQMMMGGGGGVGGGMMGQGGPPTGPQASFGSGGGGGGGGFDQGGGFGGRGRGRGGRRNW